MGSFPANWRYSDQNVAADCGSISEMMASGCDAITLATSLRYDPEPGASVALATRLPPSRLYSATIGGTEVCAPRSLVKTAAAFLNPLFAA